MNEDVFKTISLLRPYDIDRGKVYVGKERDGGYVMADLPSMSEVLSFGVGYDVSFEHDLARDGRHVYLSDHTMAPTINHERMHYEPIGICGEHDNGKEACLASLSKHLERLKSPHGCTLKMDVEGAEWDVFSTLERETLNAFDQILLEVHDLHKLDNPALMTKVFSSLKLLTSDFTIFHVHGNNCAALHFVTDMPVAPVLELSFVRTSLVRRRNSRTFYPSLNKGNSPLAHEIPLFFFPFLPSFFEGDEDFIVTEIMRDARATEAKILAGEPISA